MKDFFGPIWSKKQRKKIQIFDQNHWLTPWQKRKFCHFCTSILWSSKKANFLSRTSWKTFYGPLWSKRFHLANFLPGTSWRLLMDLFDLKKQRRKKIQIFDQNHGLTPCQKRKFCHFCTSILWSSKKANFLCGTSWKTFYGPIWSKKHGIKKGTFLIKTVDKPLWKNANFATF